MPLESYTKADIELTERRRLETPLLLLIWMGCLGFGLAEGNLFYLISPTLAVGVNWLATRRNKEVYIKRLFVNISVISATVILIIEHLYTRQNLLLTLGHYIIVIQLCKLFEKKRGRDYIQLLVLNLLLLMCTALITASPWFAFWAVAYLILACYVAMVFTLKRGLDLAARVKLHGELGPLSPRRVAWNVSRDWPAKSIRRAMLITIIPSLLMGIVVFIVTPRTSEKMGIFGQQFGAGYEPSIRLGRSREVYTSDHIVMKLQIIRAGKPRQAKSKSSRYLRRYVLNQYANSTWSMTRQPDRAQRLMPVEMDEKLRDKLIRHDISLLRIGQPDLVAPGTTVNIESPNNKIDVSYKGEYSLQGSFRPIQNIKYIAQSFPSPLEKEEVTFLRRIKRYSKASPRPSLSVKLPLEPKQEILSLAEEWCEDILAQRKAKPQEKNKLNLAIAKRIAGKLRKNYVYTLDLTESDPELDGVEDFLFHLKKGHCEYFASAMAVMCNLLEVPAQVATGFMLEEYDQNKNEYVVRGRDAHAWCEVYSPETGWNIFDPTSGTARAEIVQRKWWTYLSDYFENIRFMWYGEIVGYDFQTQRSLSKKATSETKSLWHKSGQHLTSLAKSLKESFNNLIVRGQIDLILVKFLAVLAVLAILIFLLLLLRWKLQQEPKEQKELTKKLKLIARFLSMLHRQGLPELSEFTLREKLFYAAAQFNLPYKPLKIVITLQYRWRWGGRKPTTRDLQKIRQCFVILYRALAVWTSSHRSKNV